MRARSATLFGALIGTAIAALVARIVKGSSHRHSSSDERYRPAPPDRDDPRWGPEPAAGRVQIAGKSCAGCGERITLALEGAPCDACHAPCHTKCVARHVTRAHKPDDDGTPYR